MKTLKDVNPLVSIIIPTLNSEGTVDACLESIKNQSYEGAEIVVVDGFSGDGTMTSKSSGNNLPSLSVIIVTYNCAQNLEKCLDQIIYQNYPSDKIEILVVDGGSTDETCEIARKKGARVIVNGEYQENQEARREIGMKNAKNEILAYIDSDNIIPHEDWLLEMVKPLIDDASIIGTQTLRYTYLKDGSVLNRYYGLFGVSDPVAYYLKKMDRISWAVGGWNLRGSVLEENEDYYKVKFDYTKLPTIGCNGFLIRREILEKVDCDPERFFHIDVTYDLAKLGLNTYGIVKNDVIHLTGDTFYRSLKKRVSYMKLHHQQYGDFRRYKVYDSSEMVDNLNLLKFIIYSATFIKPTFDSFKGFLKIRDMAWFLHPFMCFGITVAYGYATITKKNRWWASK